MGSGRVTILGCGPSGGVPLIGGDWGACNPANPRNRRRRASILVQGNGTTLLVDTSPDLRQQLLDAGIGRLDAVLYTHAHADHLNGIDDLRGINRNLGGPLRVHASHETLEAIAHRFSHVFDPLRPGAPIYRPVLVPVAIEGPFTIKGMQIVPFIQDHGLGGATLGFRFGSVAYSTDFVELPERSFKALEGVGTWIVDCLRLAPHQTHAHLDKVLDLIERVRPARAVLTHMNQSMDYDVLAGRLPPGVEPAYDGMVIAFDDGDAMIQRVQP